MIEHALNPTALNATALNATALNATALNPTALTKVVSPQCSCLMYTIISIFLLNTTYCVLLLVICIVRNKMAVCQLSLCWIIIWICMKRSVKFTWYDYDTNQWKETIVFTLGTLMHWMAIFSNDFIITAMINEMLWSMILIFFRIEICFFIYFTNRHSNCEVNKGIEGFFMGMFCYCCLFRALFPTLFIWLLLFSCDKSLKAHE